jgi:NADPH2:quinone reductase
VTQAQRAPRAVIADALGPIGNYALRPHDPGPPGPGQVRIAVKAAGVSFVDVLVSEGRYQVRPAVPFTPGSECAGVVEAVGDQVAGFAVGQKVVATGWAAMFADVVNAPATNVWPMPGRLSFEEAAVFAVSYTTVWHALVDRGELKAGETLLVLGAGGATGFAAVQIGAWLGARVIASASSEAKRALALAGGAHAAVDARSDAWREDVKAANAGKPIDVVFDPVGGAGLEPAFRTLGYKGRHLVVGFTGGIPALPANLPLLKGASLVGVNISQLAQAEPERARANHERVLALAEEGVFAPAVAKTYPLEAFAEAMAEAARGESAGRILLVP